MKKISHLLSMLLILLVIFAQTAAARPLAEIKKSGTINIGVFTDNNPFGYIDENGENQGYDVYFARRIAKDLGVKLNLIPTEAAQRIAYLEMDKVDVVLANFTVTPRRAEVVDFACPYLNVALGVVSPESRVITSLDNWKAEDKLIVTSGTTAEMYLTESYPHIKLQKYDTFTAAKSALENGDAVAWVDDNTDILAFAKQTPGYVVGIPVLGNFDMIAPGVRKGNDSLKNWLDKEIESLSKAKFFEENYKATMQDTYGADYMSVLIIQ